MFSVGVQIMIVAMAIEFFAWGFIDVFFSAFIRSFLDNLFFVGFIAATRAVLGLLFLPAFSTIIKEHSARMVALFSRSASVLAIVFYILAGIFMSPLLLFFGSAVHGFSWAARDISSRDFLMENAPKHHASAVMGMTFSARHLSWILAVVFSGFFFFLLSESFGIGIPKIMFFAFCISLPLFCISFLVLRKLPKIDTKPFSFRVFHPAVMVKQQGEFLRIFFALGLQMKFSLLLICFLQIIQTSLLFFLPLLALDMNLSFIGITLLMASMRMPMLFSSFFSIFEDRSDRMIFIIGGLVFSVFPLFLLSQVQAPLYIAFSALLTTLSISIIVPANLGNIASHTKRKDAPKIAALQIIFQRIGMLFGSLTLGLVSQVFGMGLAFLCIAALSVLFALFALFVKCFFKDEQPVHIDHPFRIHSLQHPEVVHIHESL